MSEWDDKEFTDEPYEWEEPNTLVVVLAVVTCVEFLLLFGLILF